MSTPFYNNSSRSGLPLLYIHVMLNKARVDRRGWPTTNLTVIVMAIIITGVASANLSNSPSKNIRGFVVQRLVHGSAISPAWSPDGKKIVYNSCNGITTVKCNINTVLLNGHIKILAPSREPASAPAWSPDGSKIVYVFRTDEKGLEVRLVSSTGGRSTLLVNNVSFLTALRWSPDGQRITYAGWPDDKKTMDSPYHIYVVSSSGGRLIRLVEGKEESEPAWSPNGKQIVYTNLVSGSPAISPPKKMLTHINLVSSHGGKPIALTTGKKDHGAIWSPNGKQIAYLDMKGNINIITPSGKKIARLKTRAETIKWSPDGLSIMPSSINGTALITLANNRKNWLPTFSPGLNIFWATWSPSGKVVAYISSNRSSRGLYIDVLPPA